MRPKEIYIHLKDGEKEAELKLSDAEEWERLALVQTLLDFFHIDSNFKDMADIYFKTSDQFKEFLTAVSPSEKYDHSDTQVNLEFPVSEYLHPPARSDEHSISPDTAFYQTGIKDTIYGLKYKCRCHCTCGYKSNHYIVPIMKTVFCYQCRIPHDVYPATSKGIVFKGANPEDFRDSFGNFFIAGTLVKI
ncbi:hypothetical protein D3C74_91700 [compost metagenome]